MSDTDSAPRLYTRCPACLNDTLTVNKGRLLCTWYECKNPLAVEELIKHFIDGRLGVVRKEMCRYCCKYVSDWVDPDWAGGRICRECETLHEPSDIAQAKSRHDKQPTQ